MLYNTDGTAEKSGTFCFPACANDMYGHLKNAAHIVQSFLCFVV